MCLGLVLNACVKDLELASAQLHPQGGLVGELWFSLEGVRQNQYNSWAQMQTTSFWGPAGGCVQAGGGFSLLLRYQV